MLKKGSLARHKDFVVDHPFIFYILTKTGSIIFVGRMTEIKSITENITKEELQLPI